MTSPFTGGNATLKFKMETYSFRGESYTVKRYYFSCDDTGRTFSNAEVDGKAMEEVYAQYREQHGIPSPSALKQLREKYGLSAHVMSKIAGIGINQYGLYENGEMPTVIVGQKLSTLFNKESLLQSIDSACLRLGKDYDKTKSKIEAYTEPLVFDLQRDNYSRLGESKPLSHHALTYRCRKSRWTTH